MYISTSHSELSCSRYSRLDVNLLDRASLLNMKQISTDYSMYYFSISSQVAAYITLVHRNCLKWPCSLCKYNDIPPVTGQGHSKVNWSLVELIKFSSVNYDDFFFFFASVCHWWMRMSKGDSWCPLHTTEIVEFFLSRINFEIRQSV